MSDNKKYYYLKLKEDFFDSEEMKVLESMKNGIEYQNVYLKMCLLSLKSDGALLFKCENDVGKGLFLHLGNHTK